MTHGSLFTGIGGFDLAARQLGWENRFWCEINLFCQRVLTYYHPKAIPYHDITQTDFTIHRGTIDVLTGGFPCQPYSNAGNRLGNKDERHLWPEMLRAIKEIQPNWIVGENVPGIISWSNGMVFNEVQTDLEAEGYEVFPYVLPACGVNAPHKRDRVWFVAHARSSGRVQQRERNTIFNQYGNGSDEEPGREQQPVGVDGSIRIGITPHTDSDRDRGILPGVERKDDSKRESKEYGQNDMQFRDDGKEWNVTNASNMRLQGGQFDRSIGGEGQEPTDQRPFQSFRPKWEEFPTQPPICGGNDGIPTGLSGITVSKHRIESIKAYGNSIVPQVALQIFKSIQDYEDLTQRL